MKLLKREIPSILPVRAVQFGEGNFLRAFIDWMLEELNTKTNFRSAVRIVQGLPDGLAKKINEQNGLYTLILRGMEQEKAVESAQIIHSVDSAINPYENYDELLELFLSPELRFCFSNTTEAGIEYQPESHTAGRLQKTFPAKLCALLHERFQVQAPGLIFLPCELIDKNGTVLRDCILKYARDWNFEEKFRDYILNANIFCNTLVDRIVAGYPKDSAQEICRKLGYEDQLLVCAEPFHFFVIEAPSEAVRLELPFDKAGLHVVFVEDQTPYRTRKVRFLNGAHTASVLAAYLAGFDFVDEMVNDPLFRRYLETLLFEEVFPTVPLPDPEKRQFASDVLERFANPYAMHRLFSISLNSVSKWKVRVLPSLLDYRKITGKLPPLLSFSLAALIAFYENRNGKGVNRINSYEICDDAQTIHFFETIFSDDTLSCSEKIRRILAEAGFWGMDLTTVKGLAEKVEKDFKQLKANGVRAAVREYLP